MDSLVLGSAGIFNVQNHCAVILRLAEFLVNLRSAAFREDRYAQADQSGVAPTSSDEHLDRSCRNAIYAASTTQGRRGVS